MSTDGEPRRVGAPHDEPEERAVCYRCHKPRLTCICSELPRVPNRTHIWVAQHPRERFHPIGTARIAQLGLENVHLEVVRGGSNAAPAALPDNAGLLYPSPTALDLASLLPSERPATLVVIDGTWAQARTLHRDNPWLQRLPHYRLTPGHESRYRLRKEPAAMCVSTIEAIVEALRILEPSTPGVDELLTSFDAMIDQQLALIEQHHRGARQRKTRRSLHGLPHMCITEPERLVVVAFEAAPRSGAGQNALTIVHCVALRMGTGETFQHFVAPPEDRFPTAWHLSNMELDAEHLRSGSCPAALRTAWHRFIADDDIVVTWNHTVLDGLDVAVGLPERRVVLKSAYRSHVKQARGALSEIVETLGLEPRAPAPLRGRAGRHVGNIVALLTHLRSDGGNRRATKTAHVEGKDASCTSR